MIKPIPCKKFHGASTVAWMAKLSEETNEVLQEAADYWDIVECCGIESGDRLADTRERLVMELTDVITLCTSWLDALGCDEEERDEWQRRVNEKNRMRGYHEEEA